MIEFEYRPHRGKSVGLLVLVIAGAVLLTYLAFTLNRPINFGAIQLTPRQGRILFGVFACLAPVGLIPLMGQTYVAFFGKRKVALTSTSIFLPRPTRMGLCYDEIEIRLEKIRSAEICAWIGRTKVLRLEYDHGVVCIPSNMFIDRSQFLILSEVVLQVVVSKEPVISKNSSDP